VNWVNRISEAVNYLESHILDKINVEDVAKKVYYSSSFFLQTFNLVTGYTFGEYVRLRRLTLAAFDILCDTCSITELSMKYGYETTEAFTKAFKRMHGVTPSAFRHNHEQFKPFSRLTVNLVISGGYDKSCKLIPHVPRVALFTDNGSYLTSFIGSLYAALYGMGEEHEYHELLMLSGAGNRLCWTESRWVFGNEDIANCDASPFAAHSRVLEAIGWKGIEKYTEKLSADVIRHDFISSIDRGIPVIAKGIIGDCADYCVVYGYENNGEKIIGWNYYQTDNGYTSDQPFIKENWVEGILGSYVLLTEKTEPKPEKERILEAFRAICAHARGDEIRGKKVGFTAWRSLLHQLEHNDFSHCSVSQADDHPDEYGVHSAEMRLCIYCDALCQIHERSVVLPYYGAITDKYPQWKDELLQAIDAWRDCASYGGFLWSQGLSFSEEGFKKFRDPAIRKILADEGIRCMKKDMEAIEHIENILKMEALT
jgi:AraC-like DNA-binding protein